MYSEKLEGLIEAIIADGEIEESEMLILKKAALKEGEDPDELEIVVKGRLAKMSRNEAQVSAHEPKSDKFGGQAMRCPACGALYVAGTAVCPECGYSFTGVKATRSSEKLYEMLMKFNAENKVEQKHTGGGGVMSIMGLDSSSIKKMYNLGDDGESDIARRKFDVIQSFPVPNSREDLIDFLTSIQPKADPSAPKTGMSGGGIPGTAIGTKKKENLGYAYWLLYANCINKARISFANDPDFAPFFSYYDAKNSDAGSKKGGFFGKFFGK